jgi:hypothetical protein
MRKFLFPLMLLSIVFNESCTSVKQIGDINMVSARNVETKMNYVLLRSYMGGNKDEIKRSKKDEVTSLENAINHVVKATPGGEFLKNVKIYLVNGKYIAVEGDVWGIGDVKESFRGFSLNDHVFYKKGGKTIKGIIVALKNDKTCFFQEFGESKFVEMKYSEITKTTFSEKDIEEYTNQKKEQENKKPLINILKKS